MTNVMREMFEEMSITVDPEAKLVVSSLNCEQRHTYDVILSSVENNSGSILFVDGLRGTGEIFPYKALLTIFRRSRKITIATATSRVVASIMSGGRIVHSRLKIPFSI
jgi:hypothetical protein